MGHTSHLERFIVPDLTPARSVPMPKRSRLHACRSRSYAYLAPNVRPFGAGTTRQGRLAPEGGESMGQFGSPQAPVTLRACLEALTHLEERYLLTSAGDEWSARELSSWLGTFHPQLLQLPVYVVPPDANGNGAIYEVAQRGHHLPDVPLYRIMRRPGALLPEEGSASTQDHLVSHERGDHTA